MNKIRIKDESGDKGYFTIIPNYILNHSTHWDRDVYIQMKKIAGEDRTCYMSQTRLAKQCGMSINRLKKSIKYLLDHGWIEFVGKREMSTKGGVQEVNEYKIVDLWKKNIEFYESKKGVSHNDTPTLKKGKGVSRGDTVGVSRGDDKEDKDINKNNSNKQVVTGLNDLIDMFQGVNPSYKLLFKNKTQRMAMERMVLEYGYDEMKRVLEVLPQIVSQKYAPSITTPYQLEQGFGKILLFMKKNGNAPSAIVI